MKRLIKELPTTRVVSNYLWKLRNRRTPSVSRSFWEKRYSDGGTSGPGSYGQLCEFKAATINEIVRRYSVSTIVDFGCGDGNQIKGIHGADYLGVDVSEDAVNRCRALYADDPRKRFVVADEYDGEMAQLATSLDVVFHLVEDEIFDLYMHRLFSSAETLVLVYSSNFEQICLNPFADPVHVRHRKFDEWVKKHAPEWKLKDRICNPYKLTESTTPKTHSLADFYLYVLK